MKQHAYGAVLIALGVWETAAFVGAAPTITNTARRHKAVRFVLLGFMAGVAKHVWGAADLEG